MTEEIDLAEALRKMKREHENMRQMLGDAPDQLGMDDDPILYLSPEHLARLKRRYPIHWREIIDMLEADAIIQRGGAHPRFIVLSCYRTWALMLGMYDLACPTERHRQRWRRSFREMLAEYPQIEEMFPAFRWRLNEHDHWVKYGFDELDPDEVGHA